MFTADVHPDWTIAGKANGGYLLATLARAAAAVAAHEHVIAASAHYLHAPDAGPGHDRRRRCCGPDARPASCGSA